MNERKDSEKKLVEKAMKGDTLAYFDLKILYLDYKPEDFLPIAKFMADSIKYSKANIDIVQKYFEIYNTYPDDTLEIFKVTSHDRMELTKYYNNAISNNLPGIKKYIIKW